MQKRFLFIAIYFLSINLFAQTQNEDEIKRVVFSFGGEISEFEDILGDKERDINMELLAGVEFIVLDHWCREK